MGVIIDLFHGAAVLGGETIAVGIIEPIEDIAQAIGRDLAGDIATAAESSVTTLAIHRADAALAHGVAAAIADLLLAVHFMFALS